MTISGVEYKVLGRDEIIRAGDCYYIRATHGVTHGVTRCFLTVGKRVGTVLDRDPLIEILRPVVKLRLNKFHSTPIPLP